MKKVILLGLLSFTIIRCSTYKEEEHLVYDKDSKSEIITLKSGVKVEKVNDNYIYQGDLILSEDQLNGLDNFGDLFYYKKNTNYDGDFKPEYGFYSEDHFNIKENSYSDESSSELKTNNIKIAPRAVAKTPGSHWAMVRFTFDSNLQDYQKSTILSAIREMESQTNVRFYNATGEPTKDPKYGTPYNYINFVSSTGNNSQIGSIGGKQTINIVSFYNHVIIHEILHSLGMFHEQSRPDRDNYVNIHLENLMDSKHSHNFDRVTKNYITIGAFDFNSIMLYDSYAFNKAGKPTMTKKDGSTFSDTYSMSELDKKFVNSYYIPYKSNPNGKRILVDDIVYKNDNTVMTDLERTNFERKLNGEPPLWDGNGKPKSF